MLRAINNNNQNGFTLVEIALVIVAISFLILGIIKASDVIRSGRLTKTIADFKEYESAAVAFREKFLYLPGDMPDARNRLSDCAAPNCFNGNRNGVIGNRNTTALADQTGTGTPDVETTMFWKHLAKANYIQGIELDSNPANPLSGSTHPTAPAGGAYSVYHRGNVHGLSIKACPDSAVCGAPVMEPKDVFFIDQKVDGDAHTRTGKIIAGSGGCSGIGDYDLEGDLCHVLYTMSEE